MDSNLYANGNAIVKMILEIDKPKVDRWERDIENESALTALNISSRLDSFSDYIEEFLLKGKHAQTPLESISIDDKNRSNGLIFNYENISTITTEKKNKFFKKLLRLKHNIEWREHLVLICNPLVFKEFDLQHIKKLLEINEYISINDKNFVCILNCGGFNTPFRFFEEPLEVHFAYNGGTDGNLRYVIILYWGCALRIKNKNAIQCIRIN